MRVSKHTFRGRGFDSMERSRTIRKKLEEKKGGGDIKVEEK
jgi:hypothetical protein